MNAMNPDRNRHILVIDDNKSIHDDFRKILASGEPTTAALSLTETALFGISENEEPQIYFEIDSAYQGLDGVKQVREAIANMCPYAMAFVDMRMPPGCDGLRTAQEILIADPEIQVVICTAYSAYSWEEITEQIGNNNRMTLLKKPFDIVETLRLANELTEKWWLMHFDRKKAQRQLLKNKGNKNANTVSS